MEARIEAEQVMSQALQWVVFTYNAFAPIVSSFRIAYTDIIPTIGVDKYARLVVNPEFVVKNQAYAQGLIIHEVLHIFFGHTTDTRTKLAYSDTDIVHNRIANIAEDCAINQFISEPLPDGAVTPSTLQAQYGIDVPYNESAEFYYDKIMESDNKPNNNACSTGEVNTQDVQDELDRMSIPHLSEEEVNEKTLDTAQQMVKSKGDQYGALVNFAMEMLEPKVDWRPLLQATVRNAEKKIWTEHTRQTYKRTSRRSQQILLPKKYGHKVSISLSFDTSGSITHDMVSQFLSEVQNCLRYAEIKECALWHTSNYWYGTPTQLMQDVERVFETGGTSESCMGRAEQHCNADLHIHFSDGEHGDNYGFAHPSKNIEIVWDDNNIKEVRRF